MSNFVELTHLMKYALDRPLNNLLEAGLISWKDKENQIGLNTLPGHEDDYHLASGSLVWDWERAVEVEDNDGNIRIEVPKFENPRQESDFSVLCNQFVGTMFEEVYNLLNQHYHVGRVRLMRSQPKTCLTWHVDHHPRVHYPIETREGCLMVIENEVKHLPKNTWWYTNTLLKHTAFNGSGEPRIHLVATILGER